MSTSSEQFPAQPAPRPWPLAPEPEPVFGMLEVFLAFGIALVGSLFCLFITLVVARHVPSLSHLAPVDLAVDPRVSLPAQLVAYVMLLLVLWRMFTYHFHIGFLNGLSWQWPSRWPLFLISGVLLAITVQFGAHFLPQRPELPIDKMIRNPSAAWMMSIFGTLIAPLVEEVLFRGLLFPALARRAGALTSLIVTSLLFGGIHASQLGGVWIQVSFIVLVGGVLTAVRWRFRSLASSTLVHVGYNGALFTAMFAQTHGFTNFQLH